MAKAKKKLLPKDFEELLKEGDFVKLTAVFEACDLNARGGYAKQTALAFDACTDELARWLVAQGADLSAPDTWGNTPLHSRARSWRGRIETLLELGANVNNGSASIGNPLHAAASSYNVRNARLLLGAGAEADARSKEGFTPLELALQRCTNINLENMASLAELLLAARASRTPRMKDFVEEIGKRFEFHRAGFNPEMAGAASTALDRLYEIFETTPVPRRTLHDGKAPIVVKAAPWQDQHQILWELLVPSAGHAATVQGEVIRISGRIAHELDGNGGVNWDADYRKMADVFLEHLRKGNPLSSSDLARAADLVASVKRKSGDAAQMAELAVAWVLQNPAPINLGPPAYTR
jgi:Ankyrin repeats (many copies)/Ankyrin repeat